MNKFMREGEDAQEFTLTETHLMHLSFLMIHYLLIRKFIIVNFRSSLPKILSLRNNASTYLCLRLFERKLNACRNKWKDEWFERWRENSYDYLCVCKWQSSSVAINSHLHWSVGLSWWRTWGRQFVKWSRAYRYGRVGRHTTLNQRHEYPGRN